MLSSIALSSSPLIVAAEVSWLAWLPSIAMVVGTLVIGGMLMAMFNRRERQMKALAAQIASDLEEARALRHQLDEAHAMASNMMVSAQRLSARLDERVAALDMASLRMNATRNALPRTPAAGAQGHLRQRGLATPAGSTAASSDLALSPVLSSIATAMAPAPAGNSLTAAVEVPVAPRASMEMKPTLDPFTQHVYELADTGRPAVTIARDLNETVGKIELILALRGR